MFLGQCSVQLTWGVSIPLLVETQVPAKCDDYLLPTPSGLAISPDLWLTRGLKTICVSIYRFRHLVEPSHSRDSSPKISMTYRYLH